MMACSRAFKLLGLLMVVAITLAGCSSTPEDIHGNDPAGVDMIPGCEHADIPRKCPHEHKKGGSDVPTVDHHSDTKP